MGAGRDRSRTYLDEDNDEVERIVEVARKTLSTA